MIRKLMCLFALVAVGCGGSETISDDVVSGKPEGEAAAGAEALVFPASQRVDPHVARDDASAVRVRAWSPSPIGPLREEAREAYRVVLEAENVTAGATDVQPAWARVRVTRDGELVEGCLGEPTRVPDTTAIGPDGALFVSLPAPCAIPEPGRYEVFVDLSIGTPMGADGSAVRTARTELVVDGSLEPFRGEELPPVTQPLPR